MEGDAKKELLVHLIDEQAQRAAQCFWEQLSSGQDAWNIATAWLGSSERQFRELDEVDNLVRLFELVLFQPLDFVMNTVYIQLFSRDIERLWPLPGDAPTEARLSTTLLPVFRRTLTESTRTVLLQFEQMRNIYFREILLLGDTNTLTGFKFNANLESAFDRVGFLCTLLFWLLREPYPTTTTQPTGELAIVARLPVHFALGAAVTTTTITTTTTLFSKPQLQPREKKRQRRRDIHEAQLCSVLSLLNTLRRLFARLAERISCQRHALAESPFQRQERQQELARLQITANTLTHLMTIFDVDDRRRRPIGRETDQVVRQVKLALFERATTKVRWPQET
jgi:hypothetical protein